jgi:hypothetical protein
MVMKSFTLVAFASLVLAGACREDPHATFTELTTARRVAADLRLQFTKTADASNRAVLADTDEASDAYAREADHLTGLIKSDVADIEPRLRRLADAEALKALDAFQRQFGDYEKLDRQILGLAVENTNLKAQRLAFGPGREAADAFRDSLNGALDKAAKKDRCRLDEQVASAVTAVREIQTLWAPHIAEREDQVMTRLEGQMAALEDKATGALALLPAAVGADARPALARFTQVSKEIVKLSRRNSNVISTDLALRKLPALTAACDESLRMLNDELAKDPFPATR